MTVLAPGDPYAARLAIDYPDRLDRFTTLLRLIYVVPILIILSLLTSTGNTPVVTQGDNRVVSSGGGIAAWLFLATC